MLVLHESIKLGLALLGSAALVHLILMFIDWLEGK